MNVDALVPYAQRYGIELSAEQQQQFSIYGRLLIEWNARLNLTRIIEPDEIVVRHFLDGLTCATVTGDLNGLRFIDVGTGGGFPGLPLKILYPQAQVTLADSVAKKTRFLQVVADELGLQGVTVIADRAEAIGKMAEHREQYDWAVGRAVAQLRILAEYLLPLVRVGGKMLSQKGGSASREMQEAKRAIQLLGGGSAELTELQLPNREELHFLVQIDKVAPTPSQYPRRVGKPSKKPL